MHVRWVIFGTPSAYLEVEVGMGIQDRAEEATPVLCPIHFVKSWLFRISEIVIPLGNEGSPTNMAINSMSVLICWRELLTSPMLVSLDYFLEETFPHLFSAGGSPAEWKWILAACVLNCLAEPPECNQGFPETIIHGSTSF